MRRAAASVVLFLSFFFSSQWVFAGERMTFKVSQPNLDERITLSIKGEQARLVSTGNSNAAVLFNAASQQLRILNHQSKTVTNIDKATIQKFASLAEGVGEIARSQGGVLGDLFKTFGYDNAIGEKHVIEHQAVAGQHQYSGVSCKMQQVSRDGQVVTQYCLADVPNLAPAERKTLISLIGFAQLLVQKGQMVLDQFNLAIPQLPNEAINGIPVYVKNIPENTVATLLGIEHVSLPAGQFSVPTGYSESVFGL